MLLGGASPSRWAVHAAVGVLGLVLYGLLTRSGRLPEGVQLGGAAVAVALIAATLLAEGLDGVHRWVGTGPVRIQPSALFAPVLLMMAARWMAVRPVVTYALLLIVAGVHLVQPDAGQATAFAAGAVVLLLERVSWSRVLVAVAVVAAAAGAWLRPDPLAPGAFVEDIVARAFQLSVVAGIVAVLSLLVAIGAPFVAAGGRTRPAMALSVYLAVAVAVTLVGAFPVPLLGFSPSVVLGVFLGLAALQGNR